jgi:hypothetical protein
LQRQLKTKIIQSQFALHLQLESEPSIGTTTKQITLRSTGSQWVSLVGVASLNTYVLTEIFLVLHPRHKLHYFKTSGWEDEWIETAQNIVREEFDRTYAFMDFDNDMVTMDTVRKKFYFIF